MSGSLEHREDDSIALYINNDLQFDSKDEHIYHEGLVLPALALTTNRIKTTLNVLIIGGGDGLVAREIFKSQQINKVDLVDYDPEILNYARTDFVGLNQSSLSNPRLSIHIKDAWDFVEEAHKSNALYDLIISDLTVPDDAQSANFHSIDWYSKLCSLLSAKGILAINSVSPLGTPEAFWCIFNSIYKGGLFVRPYHVQIPSFTNKGFGNDWGFFIASKQAISAEEFETDLSLVEPRKFIQDIPQLLELFVFPKKIFDYQPKSIPTQVGSDILIHYFNTATPCDSSADKQNSLSFEIDLKSILPADKGQNVLPHALSSTLTQLNLVNTKDPQLILEDMVKLLPTLQSQYSSELIEKFVQNPAYFLKDIDLKNLVAKLLQRAKELPDQLVTELELLQDKLQEWAGDYLSLYDLGQRVITVLTLVIIVGNLLYPDSVYGKGEHAAAAGHGARAGARRGGVNGGYGYTNGPWVNRQYWNNGVNYTNTRPGGLKSPVAGPSKTRDVGPGKPNTTGFLPSNPNIDQSAYLNTIRRDVQAAKNRLLENQKEILTQKEILETELKEYQSSVKPLVNFGLQKIEKAEAINRTQLAIQKANNQIAALNKQIAQVPAAIVLAKLALTNLQYLKEANKQKDPGNEPA